jgi:hypothetical protein
MNAESKRLLTEWPFGSEDERRFLAMLLELAPSTELTVVDGKLAVTGNRQPRMSQLPSPATAIGHERP